MDYEIPSYDPAQYSQEERIRFLETIVGFLQDEVSGLRTLIRHLVAEKMDELPIFQQTRDSFDHQWAELPDGHAMLSSDEWKREVTNTVCRYAGIPADWFRGKKVMDAGCGQGRWTYGFGKLGVAECTSFDISDAGVASTRKVAEEFGDSFVVYKKNILEDLGFAEDYDMVWCFGVLHHTGDTYRGLRNLIRHVKPGGYLYLMLYGEPRRNNISDYQYYHDIFDMRCRTRNLPFSEKIKKIEDKYGKKYLHGYFDAISPDINDLYRWDEIVNWLLAAGFEDIRRTDLEIPNHMVIARKKVS